VAAIPRKLDRHAKQAFAAHLAPLVEAVLGQEIVGCEADDGIRGLVLPDDPGGLFFCCAKSKMNERVGPPLSVKIGAACRLETQLAVKAHGLDVLFVDIRGQLRVRGDGRLHQRLAYAFAVMIRIDEKRLHVPFMQKHEAERVIRSIDRKHQGHLREEGFDFLSDRGAIRRKKEAVGGVDGPAPYVEDAGCVAGGGGTKCDHVPPLAIAIFSRHGAAFIFFASTFAVDEFPGLKRSIFSSAVQPD
jgi:hypothetical protein